MIYPPYGNNWLGGSNGDNSSEMHDVIHQGNEKHVPEIATTMAHNVGGHPQIPRFESTETSSVMETN